MVYIISKWKKVDSKGNRIVIFDGHQKHCGVDCTDENVRVVINFNYFEKKMITLILGDSKFPNLIIDKLKKKRKKFIIIDLSKKNVFQKRKMLLE